MESFSYWKDWTADLVTELIVTVITAGNYHHDHFVRASADPFTAHYSNCIKYHTVTFT